MFDARLGSKPETRHAIQVSCKVGGTQLVEPILVPLGVCVAGEMKLGTEAMNSDMG